MSDIRPRLRTLEPDSDNRLYQTLLESTLAIPFKIDWASKKYTYIGPQIEDLLGWSPESWHTVNDWAERIHPEEREQTVGRCVELCLAGVDHEAEYRAQTKDNRYVWVREVVHVLCDEDGQPTALIGFTFDITAQKKTEQLRAELEEQRLSNVRLQERLRLTQDLHDGLGGSLVYMIASVEQGNGAMARPQVLSMLKLIRNDLRQTIDSNASAQVRVPASPQEWLAPLRHRFNSLFEVLDVDCDWEFARDWRTPPNAMQYLALTRLIEEALTNVIKHSQARHVRLAFKQPEDDTLQLEIEDNGVGFDVEQVNASGLGIGMRSMSVRISRVGGVLSIESKPGRTLLSARVTLSPN
ncbi:PAS domain-containing protein [Diaphorobacter sp. HDW4A]|uniref:sensor histidine kinase n=1 Tax=Diaphorobacter sp. HDW4A TaxID=2714924 RepID=UPI0014077709|nr:PAS domain-containing protein [Diaphorobacter sp. HDW4A]QIL80341.1 PAS domain-containing protein [Diaphorobacter sp. HDW4A]